MIKAEQVPDDCADEVLLRLESAKPGAETSRSFAKLIVADAINAWPFGAVCHYTIKNTEGWELILPLPQESEETDWGKPQGKEAW